MTTRSKAICISKEENKIIQHPKTRDPFILLYSWSLKNQESLTWKTHFNFAVVRCMGLITEINQVIMKGIFDLHFINATQKYSLLNGSFYLK